MGKACPAGWTSTAGVERANGDVVAKPEAPHIFSNRRHRARHLVTKDLWESHSMVHVTMKEM
jgi:hypothetical protein